MGDLDESRGRAGQVLHHHNNRAQRPDGDHPQPNTRDTGQGAEEQWRDPGNTDTAELRELLVPYPASEMEANEVSDLVNKPQNDVAEVMARVDLLLAQTRAGVVSDTSSPAYQASKGAGRSLPAGPHNDGNPA